MLVGTSVFADDGTEMVYFYDFEDYYAESYGNVGPDAVWEPSLNRNIRSYDTGDPEHNRVMELLKVSNATLFFPGQIKQGQIRFGFDMKFKTGNETIFICAHGDQYGSLSDIVANTANTYAKLANIGSNGTINIYERMNSWNAYPWDKTVDFTKWHHIDIYFTEMSDAANLKADIYIDGERVNESSIPAGSYKNFWTLQMRVEAGNSVYIDNVYLHRYTGEEALSINTVGLPYVARKDGELRLALNDYVDKSLLSKGNIVITNSTTDEEVDNFDVVAISDREFKVLFDGEIEYGDYNLVLSPQITGKLFGGKASPFEFRTEYKHFLKNVNYLSEDFNGYTEETGALPDDFVNVSSQSTTYAKSVTGSSGETGDNALGFVNTARNRQPIAYIRRLPKKINAGDAFDVEFDIFANSTQWYMYATYDNECVQVQKILHNSNTGNTGYFADNSQTSATEFSSGIELIPNQWHKVKMHFEPNKNTSKTDIDVIFDYDTTDETEYSFTTNLNFCENETTGIGFGYLTSSNVSNSLAIDNLKVSSSALIPYPAVKSVKLYDGRGDEIKLLGSISPNVYKAVIEFNTQIAEEQEGFISFTKEGTSVPFEYKTVLNESGNSEIILIFTNLLEPLYSYKIAVNDGIESAYSKDAKLFVKKNISFSTSSGEEYRVSGIDSDGTVGSEITFVKSDDSVGEYIYAVAIFKDKTLAGGITIPTMVEINYNHIKHRAEDKGVFVSSLTTRTLEAGEYVKYYCVEYPSLNKFIPEADGIIK